MNTTWSGDTAWSGYTSRTVALTDIKSLLVFAIRGQSGYEMAIWTLPKPFLSTLNSTDANIECGYAFINTNRSISATRWLLQAKHSSGTITFNPVMQGGISTSSSGMSSIDLYTMMMYI